MFVLKCFHKKHIYQILFILFNSRHFHIIAKIPPEILIFRKISHIVIVLVAAKVGFEYRIIISNCNSTNAKCL